MWGLNVTIDGWVMFLWNKGADLIGEISSPFSRESCRLQNWSQPFQLNSILQQLHSGGVVYQHSAITSINVNSGGLADITLSPWRMAATLPGQHSYRADVIPQWWYCMAGRWGVCPSRREVQLAGEVHFWSHIVLEIKQHFAWPQAQMRSQAFFLKIEYKKYKIGILYNKISSIQ